MTHPFPAPSPTITASPLAAPAAAATGQSWWRRPRPVLVLLFSLIALVFSVLQLVGGIGTLLGPGAVSSAQVAGEIQSRVPGGAVTCSDDLTARVGATTLCSVLDGADPTDVRATVTAVDGDDVHYDLDVVG